VFHQKRYGLHAIAAAQLLPAIAGAATPNAPLVVLFPDTMQAQGSVTTMGLAGGLVSAWVNKAANRQSAPQVEAFREETAGVDFVSAVLESLKCLGVPEPRTACRELITLPAVNEEEELAAELIEKGVTELVMVNVVPLLTDEHFRVRAFVTESVVTPKGLRTTRSYGAIYDSRPPADLVEAENPDLVTAFWRDGEPARIERESLAAAVEIESALSYLGEQLGDDIKPEFAKALPKIDELEESGRVACGGTACGQVRVVRDSGPRLWLTATTAFAAYGPVIASVDENSAKHSVNLVLLALTLE
jgi:hypothetical protein